MLNPFASSSGLLLLLAAPAAVPVQPAWTGTTLQQRLSVHVPRVTVTSTTIIMRETRMPMMVEKKANDCVKMEKLSGFTVNRMDSVDLVLTDGTLLRAKLDSECPGLGFYAGFYVKPNKDQKICAGRDVFRSRTGRSCSVRAFTRLEPAR